jgi:hypothetical protein
MTLADEANLNRRLPMEIKGQHTINSKKHDYLWAIRQDGYHSLEVMRLCNEVDLTVYQSKPIQTIRIHIVSDNRVMVINAKTGEVIENKKAVEEQ